MKKINLAGKYILLSIVKVINDLMIRITNGKAEQFLRNKVTIACAIVTILTITNINQQLLLNYRPGPMCYKPVSNFENFSDMFRDSGFLTNIKTILTQR